jgi:hypothetical protein
MRSAYRNGAWVVALLGLVGLMASQYRPAETSATVGVGTPYAAVGDYFDDDVTGSIAAGAPRLELTDEQRGFVFLGVINLPDIPEVEMIAPKLAERLPAAIALHAIPAMVTRRIPALSEYRFVKLDDRILLVGAESRKVMAALPRYKLMVR